MSPTPKSSKIFHSLFAPFLNEKLDTLAQLQTHSIYAPKQRYFDFTASGLAYKPIRKRIDSLLPYYANTHSHFASNAALMSAIYDEAKRRLKQYLGLDESFALIALGSGASAGIKRFQEIMGIYAPAASLARLGVNITHFRQAHVILSGFEHHSNEISYREGLCQIHKIAFNSRGLPDTMHLEKILQEIYSQHTNKQSKPEIIASLSVASNVTGLIAPLQEYAKILRASHAVIALDMASSSPYMNVDSNLFDAAFLAPHKLLGGVGSCGLLAIKNSLLARLDTPSFAGGGVIAYANAHTHEYIDNLQAREEAGTPPILGLLYATLAYQLRNEIGLDWIKAREKILTQVFLYELSKIPAVSIYGDLQAERLGIVSFNIGSVSPLDLSALLSKKYGIQTRAGCSCAGSYGHYLIQDSNRDRKPMWLRVSLHYTHTLADIDYLIQSIKACVKILRI